MAINRHRPARPQTLEPDAPAINGEVYWESPETYDLAADDDLWDPVDEDDDEFDDDFDDVGDHWMLVEDPLSELDEIDDDDDDGSEAAAGDDDDDDDDESPVRRRRRRR